MERTFFFSKTLEEERLTSTVYREFEVLAKLWRKNVLQRVRRFSETLEEEHVIESSKIQRNSGGKAAFRDFEDLAKLWERAAYRESEV